MYVKKTFNRKREGIKALKTFIDTFITTKNSSKKIYYYKMFQNTFLYIIIRKKQLSRSDVAEVLQF